MIELIRQGGILMYPLGLCSVLTVAIFLERLWRFLLADRDPALVIAEARRALAEGGNPRPRWEDRPAPAVRAAGAALSRAGEPRPVVEDHVRSTLSREGLRLGANLGIVGTIGNIAPFIGLLGTVTGIIRAFRAISVVGTAGPAVVSAGISEALVTTAAGLSVGIVAVVAYNLFVVWQARLMRRAEIVATEVLSLVAPEA